jgi:small acid-soluble spore protein D (minor alpha/beta-type SASP)
LHVILAKKFDTIKTEQHAEPQRSGMCGSMNIDIKTQENFKMAKNKAALEKFKMEAANEVGVTLKQGYNGDITARQAGSVGGQMVNDI